MPFISIAVADAITNQHLDLVVSVSRLVVLDDSKQGRWSSARVVRPPAGGLVIDRELGVALVVSRSASFKSICSAVSAMPDPIVVAVLNKAPSKTLARWLASRGAQVVVPGVGGLVRLDATNSPHAVDVQITRLAGTEPVIKPKAKAIKGTISITRLQPGQEDTDADGPAAKATATD